ncbi:hypothetical protein N867_06735 [Actinotalea fermentans ATCC 43279 = JCM 9966 = DSM 3133]|nr:hypothetical protein N867_06735 [Actinotalea fermentans ATCC 43279 = JCM 9966 = DSM 3133]
MRTRLTWRVGCHRSDGSATVEATDAMSCCCRLPRPMSPSWSALRMRANASASTPGTTRQPGASQTMPESASLTGNVTMFTAGSMHSSTPPTASTICATPPRPISA